jgi:hypothetical protein
MSKIKYYGKVDLTNKGYAGLIKIVESGADFGAYAYGQKTGNWNKDNDFFEAATNTTDYDEITEERANKLIDGWEKQ